MDIVQRNVYILMEREHLDDIPECPLPPGYSAKWYEPGDTESWIRIHEAAERYAEISEAVYVKEFGDDPGLLASRQCFLFDAQHAPAATATAWFDDDFHGRAYGRVHWVAVVPEHQGQGLSKPLLSLVLKRMVDLNHKRAYLCTSTARLPAVNLYEGFGFRPFLRSQEDTDHWSLLNPLLHRPFDLTTQ
jgi:GNAT superfamily N-acetyltransferase